MFKIMKFKCNKNKLHEAITNVSRAVPAKSNIAALEGIKLSLSGDQLELIGYDLAFGIRTALNVESEDSGELVVNARLFSETIRRMSSDELIITVDEKLNVNISGGSAEYDISAIPAVEYPDFPSIGAENSLSIPQYILRNMIEHTNHAVAVTDTKPILTGELFDLEDNIFRMVAIDGFRMAIRTEHTPINEKISFVVPSRTLNEISKLLAKGDSSAEETSGEQDPERISKTELCQIYAGEKNITFEISGYYVVSRLLSGEFHNYKSSLPTEFKTEVIVKTREFADSIERCSLLINEKNKCPVRCIFEEGSVKTDCKTVIGKVNDVVPAEVNGEPVTIGLNNRYLLDALRACESDKIKIQMTAPNRPVKIVPVAGDSFMYLLMPIQLRN